MDVRGRWKSAPKTAELRLYVLRICILRSNSRCQLQSVKRSETQLGACLSPAPPITCCSWASHWMMVSALDIPADRWGSAASVGYCCIAAAVVIAVAAVDHLLLNPAGPSALFIDPTAQTAVAQPQQEGKRKLVSSPLLRTPTSLFQPLHTTSSTLSSSPLPSRTITHHLDVTCCCCFPAAFPAECVSEAQHKQPLHRQSCRQH
jgi:hypothetical protein